LASLDKLAEVLGLEFTMGVQKLPRRSPMGRKPRKEGKMHGTPGDLQRLAKALAKDAHTNYFSSRRGVWFVEDSDVLCLYNNNPYADYPTLRDDELTEFRRRMKEEGLKELAYATYPPEGEEAAGYTYALLIDCGEDRREWVVGTMKQIVKTSFEKMDRSAGPRLYAPDLR